MTADDSRSTRRALLKAAAGAGTLGAASTAGCVSITTPADIANATEPSGNVGYFVGAAWLADNRNDVVVLDARQEALYRRERIYGAPRVPLAEVSTRTEGEDGRQPAVETISDTFGSLGITSDDDVVVYGDSVGSRVTRTVFALLAIGHTGTLHILNGGFSAWNGRVGTGPSSNPSSRTYEATSNDELWVTREWIADRLDAAEATGIIDVRLPEAFLGATGSDALNQEQERHGHIPGAVNVHWLGNIDGGSLRDAGELFSLYANDAGLDQDGTVVVYGDENIDATQTWVTLRALGFDDVRLYEGGFTEWSNVDGDHGRYPIETATDAVIDVEGSTQQDDGGDFTCS